MAVGQDGVAVGIDDISTINFETQQKSVGGVSIRVAIGVVLLIALIVPLTIAWSLTYRQIFQNEISRVKDHHLLLARSFSLELERFHHEIRHALEIFAPEIVSGKTPVFSENFLRGHNFQKLCIFDAKTLVLTRQFMESEMVCPLSMSQDRMDLLRPLLASVIPGEAVATGVQLVEAGPRLFFALEVGGAIVTAALATEVFTDLQHPISFGQDAHLAIVDQYGRVLAHPNPAWEAEAKDLSQLLLPTELFRESEGVAEFFSPLFDSIMVAGYAKGAITGWGVIVPKPVTDFRANAAAAASQSLWALLIGLAIAAVVSLWLSKHLEGPVQNISSAFKDLSAGGKYTRLPVGMVGQPIRELNELSHQFNLMAEQIERGKLFEKRLRQKAEENLIIVKQLADSERELRLQQEERAQRDRLEALGRVVGGVAHDFNNILNVILGNAELYDETAKPQDAKYLTSEIIKATNRGSALTKQLLAYGRRAYLEPKLESPRKLLDETVKTARRLMPENIEITVTYEDKLPNILVDHNHFSIMILNLLTNARDATSGRGRIDLHVGVCDANAHLSAQETVLADQQLVHFSIVDQGVGMSQDTLARSGDPFFTTKAAGTGAGLGLPMIIGFVEQSGGFFELSSTPSVGTRAEVYFPAHETQIEDQEKTMLPSTKTCKGLKMLIVEDEEPLLKMLARQFQIQGFDVQTATSGDAAQALITAGLSVDILITDVVMPGDCQGFELARWAQNKMPDLKVVIMSGYPNQTEANLGQLGQNAIFLHKPSTSRQTLDAVLMLLGQKAVTEA